MNPNPDPDSPSAESKAFELPPPGRAAQIFAIALFFLLGVALTAFGLMNPLDLPFLYRAPAADGVMAGAAPPGSRNADPTQVYQCPMHPDVIQNEPGECPQCGMALIPVESGTSPAHERQVLYWYAPMDPTYMREEPGESPMGMKLVPRYADEVAEGRADVVRIDPVQVQNIGVVSVPAELGDIARTARTVGILDFNADLVTWVNTKFSGWIEKVHVAYVGEEVKEGDPLFEIYSPELVSTQEEYLRALDYVASMEGSGRPEALRQAESLLRSTRDRLANWDISVDQIRGLEEARQVQRRLTIRAPAGGVIVEVMKEALEGMFVRPGMNLYKIADLSSVWVHVDVYESDLSWIQVGQEAEVSFRYDGDWNYRGRTLFVYPELSKDTRTLKLCVEVPNEDGRLRAGMYANVTVFGPPVRGAVLVPDSAVLRSGERAIVFVDLGEGRFEPRDVEVGIRSARGAVQVIEGIEPGEAVVTQAQFMLDSESRVQEAIAKFMARGSSKGIPPASQAAPSHSH
jgi:Cu(I)/Ag(I) efflux system membrane fusion protein/cobalt-zinc-cadmium efflux system membrane fusion protein